MNNCLAALALLLVGVVLSSSAEDLDLQTVCEHFPELAACQDRLAGVEKRKSAYMRFGRSGPLAAADDDFGVEKRKSAYMRFGKRSDTLEDAPEEVEKRKSAYMRFGKRKSAYMRFGKRSLEAEADDVEGPLVGAAEKRKSAYMRFGRR